ncbi:MAG TPA: dienelactone hydrolase family protein [Pyrinomonadaceae bacterium]|jgi:carboxymethylenebutenolidase
MKDMMSDLNASLDYLNEHPNVNEDKRASIGFCRGGARSFLLATGPNELKAPIVFYGAASTNEQLAKTRAPVFGVDGGTDTRIASKVPEADAETKRLKKVHEYKIYPGAGRAVFNDAGDRYNAEAAQDAWQRTLVFPKKNL